MTKRWYAKPKMGFQGLVIDEADGRNVAVTYEEADMHIVAAAPELLDALQAIIGHEKHLINPQRVDDAIRAIANATGNH